MKRNQTCPDGTGTQCYESNGSDYLDDVAKFLNEVDLRPDLDDTNKSPPDNEVTNNVVTYTIGFADDQAINDPLMRDTAANGGGLFLQAGNAEQLRKAFEAATQDILKRVGSASAVTFNSGTLSTDTAVYLARFDSTRWSGELLTFDLDANGNVPGLSADGEATDPLWDAATKLDEMAPSDRMILTYGATGTGAPDGMAFRLLDDLPATAQADLNMGPTGADGQGQDRIDYLRGARGRETSGDPATRPGTYPRPG